MSRNRAAVVIVTLLALFATCWPQGKASETERLWTDKHFSEALDALFPLNQNAGIYVTYRSHRDFYTDVPEYWLVIGQEVSDSGHGLNRYLTARVRVAESGSIYDQMTSLHAKFPNDSVEEIRKQVRVRESVFTEMSCPAVKSQFAHLQHRSFAMPHFNEIVIHPLVHEIRVQAGTGDINAVLSDEDNDLVRWALETKRALESCSTAAQVK